MLAELWHYAGMRTADRNLHRLGYAHEAAALEVRHIRRRDAWRPHLQASQAALLAAAQRLQGDRHTALIVGGGLAHDIPIKGLLAIFDRLVLLDVAFSRTTRGIASASRGRIETCYWDATGLIDTVAQSRRIPRADAMATNGLPPLAQTPDWIASVNCWLQLPLLPAAWLQRHGAAPQELEIFCRDLIDAHWHWLAAWGKPFCVINEVGDRHHAADGRLLDETDYRPLLQRYRQQATLSSSWVWQFHPRGTLPKGESEQRFVEAWEIGAPA